MTLEIYNTLTRKKEPFKTLKPNRVSMYVCGPTVYDKAHVGHAMSVLVFDVIRRYLEYKGYEVELVMNYTDVDDKIIQRALVEDVDSIQIAERYIEEFNCHLEALNVLPAAEYPRATDEIKHIIKSVKALVDKGYAYQANGDVFYRIEKFDDYGKLSGRDIEDMEAGSRVDVDSKKEHPMDFALWKAAKPNEPSWDSPWGKGRPGWHIECSVMSLHHLGEQIDIHGGGNDLVFPHHENEIAQSEALTGKQFASYWVHNGMMQLSGAKMSKSMGNLVTIDAFLEEYEANVLRMMVLNSSYRSPLKFNEETIEHAQKALKRLRSALKPARSQEGGFEGSLVEEAEKAKETFQEAMDDDFNTSAALAGLFDLVREINQARDVGADDQTLAEGQRILKKLTGVIGLELEKEEIKSGDAEPFIDLLVEVRDKLRESKQWELSDKIRDDLEELGVILEDSPQGTQWHWE
ncbi:MAG: cysteine--tRNA ligase [Anaerolineales bacterium]|nr:cysteine--tRNA ligase [Anaerolineales bacterium]MBS3752045.1 cysteine--tRNA ligase [Anaerolineales bacterium]